MNDVDTLLHEAGARWRAGQPDPPTPDLAAFPVSRERPVGITSLVLGVAGAALVLVVALQLGSGPGVGGRSPIGSGAEPSGAPRCDVTRPIPRFEAPSPYPESPPAYYESDWFGSRALWTMIDRDGEVWAQSGLPHGPGGLTQKRFYWSADRTPQDDLAPAIMVTGTRLDGPGTFEFGPGTNASADFGPAMLVGVEFPTPGCWLLTARYRDAVLSYVVLITED
jgi:hypothetical protein